MTPLFTVRGSVRGSGLAQTPDSHQWAPPSPGARRFSLVTCSGFRRRTPWCQPQTRVHPLCLAVSRASEPRFACSPGPFILQPYQTCLGEECV
ncbi:hypothetical protein GGTG_03869 [Gaeumannomyces tritici R3-111a-1]|uniref:Uncharacterized protein n=1 Tax=Gaeumannomyces tritici (strain R3-111a-1) TaxID=644352 RepID=J3NRG5_GAET3|nr:hypothetical protein GGTG_03869 [Gaeumannomyces tritici R3-111a-1]EJT78771.1 hypothetical protein GGTG_03869 [Gaeumannomyces tritici R3-111a-1]